MSEPSVAPIPPYSGEPVTHTGEYYSVPRFLMEDYLRRLGGAAAQNGDYFGEGWRATLRPAPWRHVGSLRIGGTTLTLEAEQATLDRLLARLHTMTLRGGG